ncbi:MAG: UvrD-helicase domain-containing protein [Lachnospiraceae bacterium]|nr:UvrD-helicase domain-containing protein [Lachnospiraceae bacterium]
MFALSRGISLKDILEGLNEEQIKAVTTTEGYVRVIAGAGSGKTKTLTHRYAYLVNELGIATSNIACVTFTNKAAKEMKNRIKEMIGDGDVGYICTFHGLGVYILREDIYVINYPDNFVILDTEDTETMLKDVYEKANLSTNKLTFDEARLAIAFFKSKFSHISFLENVDSSQLKELFEKETNVKKKVIYGYLYEQKKNFGLDFDDLITVSLYILRNYEDKRKKWQERMMYVMVDEFQDVSNLNYELAKIISDYHKNLFIVGDPDQTIYSWRGADVKYIVDFGDEYPGYTDVILSKNYRSSPEIIDAANSLIKNNKYRVPYQVEATRESNVITAYYHGKTSYEEAKWVADKIKLLHNNGIPYSMIAILYRSHYVSRSFEEELLKNKLPYVLYSGVEFYKRKEIKDVISFLRMLTVGDDLSFVRVVNEPRRNIGKKRIEILKDYAQKNQCSLYEALQENLDKEPILSTRAEDFVRVIEKYRGKYKDMRISDVITGILNDSGYEAMLRSLGDDERLENIAELKNSVFEYEKNSGEICTLEDYLRSIALYTNTDREEKQDAVKLMTIHIAKGLEFPYVFVVGLNEGIFPTGHTDTEDALEEERRLAYVAYTRAMNALFLTDSEGTNYDGSFRYPSRFIFNTDRKYLNYEVELDDALIRSASAYIANNEEVIGIPREDGLKAGDRVNHKVFGPGEIIDVRHKESCYVIKFDKFETFRNLSFRVELQKID